MPIATLAVGDMHHAEHAADRDQVHRRLAAALAEVNGTFEPVTPLRITVGDEYQGGFARIGDAVLATLRLRLALAPEIEVRHGLGWGDVRVLQEEPRVEDGPGWGPHGRRSRQPRTPRTGPDRATDGRSSGAPTGSRAPTLPRSRPC